MTDIEKVIQGLECCSSLDSVDATCMVCPYYHDGCEDIIGCLRGKLIPDAIVLLKKLEPKQVRIGRFPEGKPFSHCPRCGTVLDEFIHCPSQLRPSYCPICGQAVKWNE